MSARDGFLSILLHAHLPFVRHPEHEEFLEEDWLYEAITETYIPLLRAFDRLADDGVEFRITISITPPLASMLSDELLRDRYVAHIERLIELAGKEVARTASDPALNRCARMYLERFNEARRAFVDIYRRDLLAAFRALADAGYVEIVTCGATHGFLPLMQVNPAAVRAQIEVAVESHRDHFGRRPSGIWLPECGYWPGHDRILKEAGIRFTFLDAHGVLFGTPRPKFGIFAPVISAEGIAFFGRDLESSREVWSADEGYPGDYDYREFHRDLGFDAEYDYIKPYIHPMGFRTATGIKYHRITSKNLPLQKKRPYDPEQASRKALAHASDFLAKRERQASELRAKIGRPPIILSPYDAELYGHWWYEGPVFLEHLLRKAAESRVIELTTPAEYLERHPTHQLQEPSFSSWGDRGYSAVWLDGCNDWIYRHLHEIADRMITLARDFPSADGLLRRALNQAARELLLAQSSDWAFIISTGTMVEYAVRRTRDHISRFLSIDEQIRKGEIDEDWLAEVEWRDNIFPRIDYRVYTPRPEDTEG